VAKPTKAVAKMNLTRGTLIVAREFGAEEGAAIKGKGCPGFHETVPVNKLCFFSKIQIFYLGH
jgi:hypothetical protein